MTNNVSHLDPKATAHEFDSRHVVDRYPLSYLPQSPTTINYERLPDDNGQMELAYRERSDDVIELRQTANFCFATAFLGALAAWMMLLVAADIIPARYAAAAAGAGTLLMIIRRTWILRSFRASTFLIALIAPTLAVILLAVGYMLILHRALGFGVLSVIVVYVFYRFGSRPLRFYRDWLYTHPRLRPNTRHTPEVISTHPSYALLAFFILSAGFIPYYSPALCLALLALTCAVVLHREVAGFGLMGFFQLVIGEYITYGRYSQGAPGCWRPEEGRNSRKRAIALMTVAFHAFLALSLSFFLPWDVFFGFFFSRWLEQQHLAPNDPSEMLELAGQFREVLNQSPHLWALWTAESLEDTHGASIWFFVVALTIGLLLPPWMLLAIYRAPLVSLLKLRRRVEHDLDNDERPEWQWYVDRVRGSNHIARDPLKGSPVREAEHLFMGVEPFYSFPVLLDERILAEHAYIVGETGSGKTSLGILPLLIQLLRGHAEQRTGGEVSMSPPPPMVIIDLKGDPALFNTVRLEVEARRQELGITDPHDPRYAFRFFTAEQRASHYFNPFKSLEASTRTLMQICQIFLDSLSLSHGEGYGRSYYSRKNRYMLHLALKREPAPRSIEELYEHIQQIAKTDKDLAKDTYELVSTIHALAQYEQLALERPLKRPEDAIHMPSLLQHSQVAYFWLPAAIESVSVREIAKLALYCLLSSAIDRQTERKPRRQVYLVIDEFQRIAAENFKIILEQARSFGVSAILSNQTQSDLRTPDIDLRTTVRTNTRFKQFFGLSDAEEIQDLKNVSGEELFTLRSWATPAEAWWPDPVDRIKPRQAFETKTESEQIKTRFTTNDILAIGDHPLHSIIQVSRGEGYTQFGGMPIPLRSTWPLHLRDYTERQKMPWPIAPNYELELVAPGRTVKDIEQQAESIRDKHVIEYGDRINALFEHDDESQDD